MSSGDMSAGEHYGGTPLPLSRNRNYNLLWVSQLLSQMGTEIALVGFPLLILATSGSPLEMAAVSATVGVASMVANVPAGVLADRWDRKKILLMCQCARAVGIASLAVALALDAYVFWHVLLVAVVEGFLGAMFEPTEDAALPQVVPSEQLSAAVARNTVRPYVATLAGPALAGVLFTVGNLVPFALNAAMLAVSFVGLLFLVLPPRAAPAAELDAEPGSAYGDFLDGLRWVLGHRVIRVTLVWLIAAQLIFSALILIILAASGEQNISPGEIGLTMACLGGGGVLGAVFAARLHATVPARVIIIGFSWIAVLITSLMVLAPAGLPLGLLLACVAFFVPVMVTTVMTYQMVATADELRGRTSSVVGLCAGGANAMGPLVGGLLVTSGDSASSLLVCAVGLGVVAVGATLSPTLRNFPTVRMDEGEASAPDPSETDAPS